jgi:hypothetical protein
VQRTHTIHHLVKKMGEMENGIILAVLGADSPGFLE